MLGSTMLTFDDDVPDELRHRARNIIETDPSLYRVGVFIRLGLTPGGYGRWVVHEAFFEQDNLTTVVRETLQRAGEPLAP